MTAVAVVYHSATGRTRALAEAVVRGATAVDGTSAQLYAIDGAGGAASIDHAALLAADAIVFGCPTYMGSASAAFKAFMDGTSAIWALQAWRDKLAAAFTHSSAPSGDKLGTLMQLAVFAAQHGMVWVGLGLPPTYIGTDAAADTNRLGSHLGAMAQSSPGARSVPEGDLATAELLGKRVAEAARRWRTGAASAAAGADARDPNDPHDLHDPHDPHAPTLPENPPPRHPTTTTWVFPPLDRPTLPAPLERTNLRELIARPERYEHHLVVCATIAGAQLEVVTASEPLYFGHVNFSDEYALALPCGDSLVDRFPLRTFLSDAATGEDVGRYNHRIGDVVLHPVGSLHWPGRLRPPYEPFDIPVGVRRCGLSLVFCASAPAQSSALALDPPPGRTGDVKRYVAHAPPMALASTSGAPGVIARIGAATLTLVERQAELAPPRGGWVVVLEAESGSGHAACDLIRVPPSATLDGTGIVRALVLAHPEAAPDPVPPSWQVLPRPPFAPLEDSAPLALPHHLGALAFEAVSATEVGVTLGAQRIQVPRYWLARMLFRCALHGLRLGYVETYGGLFVDDRGGAAREVELGIRAPAGRASIQIPRLDALDAIERLYRAVAPPGYRERLR